MSPYRKKSLFFSTLAEHNLSRDRTVLSETNPTIKTLNEGDPGSRKVYIYIKKNASTKFKQKYLCYILNT